MSRRGGARKRPSDVEKLSDEEYILKRQRNNDAVNRFIFIPSFIGRVDEPDSGAYLKA